jgi:hypothetical protein
MRTAGKHGRGYFGAIAGGSETTGAVGQVTADLGCRSEATMSWLLAIITKWRAARRAARLNRIRQIVSKGLSAIE